jgi:hypothetical protein
MKITTKTVRSAFAVLIIITSASCAKLDVVGTDSTRAFGDVLETLPPRELDWAAGPAWSLDAPDGAAAFLMLWDKNTLSDFDLALEIDSRPFLNAGLDASKLNGWEFADGKLLYALHLDKSAPAEYAAPLEIFKQIVKNHRSVIGWHAALDHYGVSMGDGNLFEWAKDMTANDKDMVFVLNPDPFIAAGVDPAGIEGWAFAKVTVDDENGKPVQVDKILKPFNLR